MFTDAQREHLCQLAFSVVPDACVLDDHELLIAALVAAYKRGITPQQMQDLFVGKWRISRKVVYWGLMTIIASRKKPHSNGG